MLLLRNILVIILMSGFVISSVRAESVPKYGARYDYKFYDCNIKENGFSISSKVKLTIYNRVGEDYRYVTLSESDFIRLKDVKIRVIDSQGKIVYEKKQDDMTKFCGYDGSSLFNDVCHYQIELRCNQFPYSIEYEYCNEYQSLFFWRGESFQSNIPIDTIEYNISTPSYFSYQHKVYGDGITYSKRSKDGLSVETFSAVNVPELEKIDYLPTGAREPLKIRFAAESFEMEGYRLNDLSWDGIGDWYNEMAYGKYTAFESGDSSASISELILEAYNNVIENIRYVAIEIGLGGWQPYEASLTEKRGFGDCKDMATLLMSNLNKKGVTTYPVLVLTKDEGLIDVDFPSIGFNHVIAVSINGNDTTWMDPTCNNCPLGELPVSDEDIDVLVITPDGGVIRKTPSSTPFENRKISKTNIHIGSDLYSLVEITKSGYGNYGRYLKSRLNGENIEDTERYLYNLVPGGSKKYKLIDYTLNNVEEVYQSIEIRATFKSLKKVDKLGPSIYVDPFLMNKPYGRELLDFSDREYPVKIVWPFANIDTTIVTWDETIPVGKIKLPVSDSLYCNFGNFKTYTTSEANTVTTTFEKEYYNYKIDPVDFKVLNSFNKKLKDVTSKHLKLTK